jgi:nitrate/nitrite-specific signal transduction histidine kinase
MRFNLPLRARLIIAFVVVALVPIGLLVSLNNRATRSELADQANQALFAAASQTAARLDAFIGDNLNAVRTEAQLIALAEYLGLPPNLRGGSVEEKAVFATLRALRRKDATYISSYALLDYRGVNVVDTFVPDIGVDESRSEYYQIPMTAGLPFVSPVLFSVENGNGYLYFSSPVSDLAGHTIGVLRVRYDAAVLQHFMVESSSLAGEKVFGVLFDENHVYLAHGIAPEAAFRPVAVLEPARLKALQAAQRVPDGEAGDLSANLADLDRRLTQAADQPFFEAPDIATGRQMNYVAAAGLKSQPWLVAFFQPRDSFLAPLQNQTRVSLLLAAGIAAASVLAAVSVGRLLTRPLSYLTETVTRFSKGDLQARAEIGSGDEIGLLAATFNAMAEQVGNLLTELEDRVKARTRELSTLLDVSHNVVSTLQLEPLLGLILDQLKMVIDYDGASILTVEGDILSIVAYRGPILQEEALQLRFPIAKGGVNYEVVRHQQPLIISNVWDDTTLAREFQRTAGGKQDIDFGYVCSWMGVPLISKGRVMGMVTLDHGERDYFTPQHAELVFTFANQVAVAIENAHLYEAEQERLAESERRRRVAEGLREIVAVLNSNRSLQEVLDHVVHQAAQLMRADVCILHQFDYDHEQAAIRASHGLPAGLHKLEPLSLFAGEADSAIVSGRPYAKSRPLAAREFAADAEGLAKEWREALFYRYPALLAVPVVVNDVIYGSLAFYYSEEQSFPEEEIGLAIAFSDQAALAIENARLRAQAEETAVAAERNRLARDLHDAVTQTLFSASLIADVLPRMWERDLEEGWRRLQELRELNRGALAEMRTLLLELRPTALEEADLDDLLSQLVESVIGRARLPIDLEIEGECVVPPDVKVALYRIAQESLNNVAKHAGASQAAVNLHCSATHVTLRISDDGRGFDTAAIPPEHLGLGIMQERAEAIGAQLTMESQIGCGTKITIAWQDET